MPDGLTTDTEDYVWSAFWGSNRIRRFGSAGTIIQEIIFPAKQVTSITFGGKDMDRLFVTSASQGADDPTSGYQKDGTFLGGPTYMVTFQKNIKGRPEWLADF